MTSYAHSQIDKDLPRMSFKKPAVIINVAAGSTSDISQDIALIFEHHNYPPPTISLVEPEDLSEALSAIGRDGTDLLVIYGGDGTCKAGAIAARAAAIPIIALPGGTMNMLPKAFYGTDDWKDALELALSQKTPRWQTAGSVNGNIFFCGAILGDPIVMSEARESLRQGEVLEAIKQLPEIVTNIAHGTRFEFKVDGELFDVEANGLQIYCPFMTSGAKDPTAFELASVPQLSMTQVIGIGARALAQDWRDSVLIKTAQARHIQIKGQGAFDILLDGELEQIACPITIALEPEGVLVLAPDLHEKAQ